jgi:glycosyltransferase involved in cell wall biosynthesis
LAFNLLVKKYSDRSFKLLIVGDGSQREALASIAKFYNLKGHVIFVGAVNHKSIPFYINKLDVLVNVSEMESFGVSVAEAMACKTPVIVSNLEGFQDLVPDEKVGLITKSTGIEDIFICMEKYFLNSKLRVDHREEAFNRINEYFNWNKNLLEMENLYSEVS